MSNIIKYKRFTFSGNEIELQEFFDKLITDGYEIFKIVKYEEIVGKRIDLILICKKLNNI